MLLSLKCQTGFLSSQWSWSFFSMQHFHHCTGFINIIIHKLLIVYFRFTQFWECFWEQKVFVLDDVLLSHCLLLLSESDYLRRAPSWLIILLLQCLVHWDTISLPWSFMKNKALVTNAFPRFRKSTFQSHTISKIQ